MCWMITKRKINRMLLFEQKIIKSFHTIYITLRTGSYIKNMIGLIKTQTTLLKLLSTVLYKRDGTLPYILRQQRAFDLDYEAHTSICTVVGKRFINSFGRTILRHTVATYGRSFGLILFRRFKISIPCEWEKNLRRQ